MGKLTALKVARATERGLYSDGDGLYLQVSSPTARSWVYRYTLRGKARYLGLGSASAITLKRARELVAEPRRLHAEGIDPLDHKHAERSPARPGVTFKECAERFIAAREQTWRSERHRQQWRTSLEADAYPKIGHLPVNAIDTAAVLSVLQPIWTQKPESASRLRNRIENVLDAAKAAELRQGENPARWKGHLANLLAAPRKLRKAVHLAAM